MVSSETLRINPVQDLEEYRVARLLLHEDSQNALLLVAHHVHAGTFKAGKSHFPNGYVLVPEMKEDGAIMGVGITCWQPNLDREELIFYPESFHYTLSRQKCTHIIKQTYSYDAGEVIGQYPDAVWDLHHREVQVVKQALRSEMSEEQSFPEAQYRVEHAHEFMRKVIPLLEVITGNPLLLCHDASMSSSAVPKEMVASL